MKGAQILLSQKFYPDPDINSFVRIPASNPHPLNTEYYVSLGCEIINGIPHRGIKILLAYDDNPPDGRRNVFYPNKEDLTHVMEAAQVLLSK